MRTKRQINPSTWTSFWKHLGIITEKRNRFKKDMSSVRRRALPQLVRIGVNPVTADNVFAKLAKYKDPLVFYYFSKLFRRDPETIQEWTETNSIESAFKKLFNIFQYNSLDKLRIRFRELYYLNELNKKGEGWSFQAKYTGSGSVFNIKLSSFTRLFNIADNRYQYKPACKIRTKSKVILCFDRILGERKIHKFIIIDKQGNLLNIKISVDSQKEVRIAKAALRKEFDTLIDSPQVDKKLNKLSKFLKVGESKHFVLTRLSLFHDDYLVNISPKYNLPSNITEYSIYKNNFESICTPQKSLVSMRFLSLSKNKRTQINIDVRNYQTSTIIGALILSFNDKKLNNNEKKQIREDFEKDFAIPLDTFISVKDIGAEEIYNLILNSNLRRSIGYSLRSNTALKIYSGLVQQGLFDLPEVSKDEPRYCINRNCNNKYTPVSKYSYCDVCGEVLLPGKEIVLSKLNDKNNCNYIVNVLKKWDIQCCVLKRKILNKSLRVIQIRYNKDEIEIIPIINQLNENQVLLLGLRYLNALILSSKDNLDSFSHNNITANSLSHFIYKCDFGTKAEFINKHTSIVSNQLNSTRNEIHNSYQRMSDNRTYSAKERQVKNLGAELFEADCSILLKYMFGNSIWLGAKTRGKAVPDGITAFPILGKKQGCFIWDAKYGKGQKVQLGGDDKNKRYIIEGRVNKSIKENGFLKALIFISNKKNPQNFENKYQKFLRKNKIGKFKIVFLKSKQLVDIFDHFRSNEADILNNQHIQEIFVNSIKNLFFSTKNNRPAEVVSDSKLKKILNLNCDSYNLHRINRVSV